jgi:hypothetical protein
LILVLVEYSLYIVVEITSLVKGTGYMRSTKSGRLELLSLFSSSELVGKLYYILSLSLVYLLEYSLLDELGGNESSDCLSNKSGKSKRPPKVAIIN